MANNITWQSTNFQPVVMDPTKGLAAAAKAFGNIGDRLIDRKEQESLATNRAEKLALDREAAEFVMAEPQRAREEEARVLAASAEQGILANEIGNIAGGSRADAFFGDIQNAETLAAQPGYQELSGLYDGVGPMTPENQANVRDFEDKAVAANKRLFSDPSVYRDTVESKLLETGKFSREDASAIAAQKTTQLFPTMDPTIAGKLLQKPGTASSVASAGTGRGGAGTDKLLFSQAGPGDDQDMINNFFTANSITDNKAELQLPEMLGGGRPLDPGGVNINKNDVHMYLAKMAQSSDGKPGVNTREALRYLQVQMKAGGVTSKRIDKLSDQDLEDFKTGARNMLAGQERTFNSKAGQGGGGGSAAANLQATANYNNAILSQLNPDRSTREKRMAAVLSGLPGGRTANTIVTENAIDVATPKVAPKAAPKAPQKSAPAAETGIMPKPKGAEAPEAELQRLNAIVRHTGTASPAQLKRAKQLNDDMQANQLKARLDAIDTNNMLVSTNGDIINRDGSLYMTAKQKQEIELAVKANNKK